VQVSRPVSIYFKGIYKIRIMNRKALELYLYMGSTEPIITWLKKEGVKTQSQAKEKLAPLVESNVMAWASHIGRGNYGVSLAGTSNGIDKILKEFENDEPNND
jgi:hypothetical protein